VSGRSPQRLYGDSPARVCRRIGYGTMRLTGPGVIGPPADPDEARLFLARAPSSECGYSTQPVLRPDIPNRLLAEATRSYRRNLVIATKLAGRMNGAGRLVPAHTARGARTGIASATSVWLGTESGLDLFTCAEDDDRAVSPAFRRSLATMIEMREAGLFRHIGLSTSGWGSSNMP